MRTSNAHRLITLRHLRCFVAVAQTGSFTGAAQRVHLTQSSLTTIIRQLESSLGLRLFDRTTRRVLLTDAARPFLDRTDKLLREFDMLVDDTQALARGYSGHLNIAASPSIIASVLVPALEGFRAQSPGVSISIRDAGSAEIERRVRDGEADFGVCSRLRDHPELEYQPLLRDRYVIVCSQDHPFVELDRPVTWDDVSRHRADWVGLASDTLVGRVHQEVLNDVDPAIGYLEEVSSTSMLEPMLELGHRFSIIPGLTRVAHRLNGFPYFEIEPTSLERELCLVTRRLRAMSPAAAALRDAMRAALKEIRLPEGTCIVEV